MGIVYQNNALQKQVRKDYVVCSKFIRETVVTVMHEHASVCSHRE